MISARWRIRWFVLISNEVSVFNFIIYVQNDVVCLMSENSCSFPVSYIKVLA